LSFRSIPPLQISPANLTPQNLLQRRLPPLAFLSPALVARMSHRQHSGWLVDNHKVFVKEQNLDIDVSRHRRKWLLPHLNYVAWNNSSSLVHTQNPIDSDPPRGHQLSCG